MRRCFTIALRVSSQSGLSLGWMLLWSSGTKSSSSECTEDFIILERKTEMFDTQGHWGYSGAHLRGSYDDINAFVNPEVVLISTHHSYRSYRKGDHLQWPQLCRVVLQSISFHKINFSSEKEPSFKHPMKYTSSLHRDQRLKIKI